MLTSFDVSFDYTFAAPDQTGSTSLPVVGGDGGGGIAGAVLPFSTNPALLASCMLGSSAQSWERWEGIPIWRSTYLMPFILKVSKPGGQLGNSPFCQGSFQIVNADTGVVVRQSTAPLHFLTDATTLYILHSGSVLATPLPDGVYRIIIGSGNTAAVSDPFRVKCLSCDTMYLIRLKNDTPLGDLLYDRFNFEQAFYVEGELTGPTYEESETRSGTDKTTGTVKKIWTLTLDEQSEPVADALARAGLHRLVEVSLIGSDGTARRSIQALAYEAKGKVSNGTAGGLDIVLTLPVSLSEWKSGGGGADGCLMEDESGTLTEVICTPPDTTQ